MKKEFDITPKELEEWICENKGEYTGDIVEGVLLDSFVIATKRGFAAVYEKYCNEWTSCYHVVFETGAAQSVFDEWYEFEQASIKQAVEIEDNYKKFCNAKTETDL